MDNKKFTGIFIPGANFYLWIIFVLVVVIGILNIYIAIPGYILLLFLVYYNFKSNHNRQKEITRYIENLSFNIDTATKGTLLNFPMPLSLVELDGTIIWYNSSFRKLFDGEELLDKNIGSIIEDLSPGGLNGQSPNTSKDIVINQKHYTVFGNVAAVEGKNNEDSYIQLLYFIDNTEFNELKRKYADEKAATGIIIIDNYDDLMQSTDDSGRPQILAEIEKKVTQWTGFTEGVLKKYERDKYLYIFEQKYLKEFEDKKFEILESIKEINAGNKIPVTLSLGFGVNGKSMVENFYNAAACIDIALGRGGDHVVIRNGENFSFFGGKTRELEKRTKVKARVIAYALRELIDKAPMVFIMGHEHGDIDSLGASMGLYRIVKNRGKDAFIVINSANSTIENTLDKIGKNPEYEGIFIGKNEALDRISGKTLLIVVDTHKPKFTEFPELLDYTSQVVIIDHHRRGADFIQNPVLTYQETYASSTCELVTEILQYVEDRIRLKPVEAEVLYAGIVMDTKNFTFKTGVRTFEAASFLRRQGVDPISVKQLFQNDLDTYVVISDIIRGAEIINDNIAISTCPANLKNAHLVAAKAADSFLGLSGITASFVLGYMNNEVFISGRSLGDVNVQAILEKLGGGGHLTGAGAQLQGMSVDDAKEKLKYVIIDYINDTAKEG